MEWYWAIAIAVGTGIAVALFLFCIVGRPRVVTAHYSRTRRGNIRWALKDGKGGSVTVSHVNGFKTRRDAERDAERLAGLKVVHLAGVAPYVPKPKKGD